MVRNKHNTPDNSRQPLSKCERTEKKSLKQNKTVLTAQDKNTVFDYTLIRV